MDETSNGQNEELVPLQIAEPMTNAELLKATDVDWDKVGLGTMSDRAIAHLLGDIKLKDVVRRQRMKRKIPAFDPRAQQVREVLAARPPKKKEEKPPAVSRKVAKPKQAAKATAAPSEGPGLNDKEQKVLELLQSHAKMTIREIARLAFKGITIAKADSWVRNSLRRLRATKLIKKVGRGTYAVV